MEVERLADAHLLREAEIAERDLTGDGPVVRDREDLHPERSSAVRLGEDVAIGLDAIREHDRAAQVARRIEPVGELHRARDVGRSAEARAPLGGYAVLRRRQVVTLERRCLLRVVGDSDDTRALRERDDSDDRVFGLLLQAFRDLLARVLDRGVGHRLGDVDEVDRRDLLRRRRSCEPREAQREQRDERHAEDDREDPLRKREIGEAPTDHPEEEGREQREPEHLRREQLVVGAVPRERDRRLGSVQDRAPVDPHADEPDDAADDREDDSRRLDRLPRAELERQLAERLQDDPAASRSDRAGEEEVGALREEAPDEAVRQLVRHEDADRGRGEGKGENAEARPTGEPHTVILR